MLYRFSSGWSLKGSSKAGVRCLCLWTRPFICYCVQNAVSTYQSAPNGRRQAEAAGLRWCSHGQSLQYFWTKVEWTCVGRCVLAVLADTVHFSAPPFRPACPVGAFLLAAVPPPARRRSHIHSPFRTPRPSQAQRNNTSSCAFRHPLLSAQFALSCCCHCCCEGFKCLLFVWLVLLAAMVASSFLRL